MAPDVTTPRWLIYALGGGMGHLHRALALARAAARQNIATCVLTNSPFADSVLIADCRRLVPLGDRIQVMTLPSHARRHELTVLIEGALTDLPYELLIVDTFPRGLLGELVTLLPKIDERRGRFQRALIGRDLEPRYVAWANVPAMVEQTYDLVIAAEPNVTWLEAKRGRVLTRHSAAPWLICGADEWLMPMMARAALNIEACDSRPVALVLGCGQRAEAVAAAAAARALAARVADRTHVRFVSCDPEALAIAGTLGLCLWPALAVLPGVDLLLGAGGYNTVYEARATRTPLLAVPQPRRYDRQALRLRESERCTDWQQAIDRAAAWLAIPPGACTSAAYDADHFEAANTTKNGAVEALPWLRALAGHHVLAESVAR